MAAKKLKKHKKVSNKSKPLSKNVKGTALKLGDIFSFSTRGATKKDFSSSFEYENLMVDLKGNVKNGEAKLNIKAEGKSFNFKGVITINEKSFKDMYLLFSHLLSNVKI